MTTASKLSSSPCLQGERVAFTGTLTSMTHKEAFEHVVAHGGIPARHVSGQTTVLVVGDEGWPLENDGRASTKFLEARQRISNREAIRILDESEWLHAIGLSSRDHAHRV